jgi:uncharacterized membrane protein
MNLLLANLLISTELILIYIFGTNKSILRAVPVKYLKPYFYCYSALLIMLYAIFMYLAIKSVVSKEIDILLFVANMIIVPVFILRLIYVCFNNVLEQILLRNRQR